MNHICPRCYGAMYPGKAMQSTVTGTLDFPGGEVVTLSHGGPGRLIDCLKCSKCGYSTTIGNDMKTKYEEGEQ